jgi:Regulator of chromosome condensation (RCC1) repeat
MPALRVVDLVAASGQACVWLVDSRVACWMLETRAYDENLGTSAPEPPPVAHVVQGLPPGRLTDLAVYSDHGCAVTEGGAVGCWTYDPYLTHDAPGPRPAVTVEVHGVTSVSLSPRVAMAARRDGSVWSWGLPWGQEFGSPTLQMASGHHPDLAHPAPMEALHDVKQVAINVDDHACALLTDGSVECWGDNDYGDLGAREPYRAKVPVRADGLGRALAVGLGWYGSGALVEGGQVWCWGVLMQAAKDGRACNILAPMPEMIHNVTAGPRGYRFRRDHRSPGSASEESVRAAG